MVQTDFSGMPHLKVPEHVSGITVDHNATIYDIDRSFSTDITERFMCYRFQSDFINAIQTVIWYVTFERYIMQSSPDVYVLWFISFNLYVSAKLVSELCTTSTDFTSGHLFF